MKKTIAYFTVAVFLGIALILTPSLILQETKPARYLSATRTTGASDYNHYPYDFEAFKKPESLIDEFMVPAVGLVVASAGYVVFKRKITSHKPN